MIFPFSKTFLAPLEAKIPPGMPKLLKNVFQGHSVGSVGTLMGSVGILIVSFEF